MTIALVDGDIVAFRCAASAENEPEEIAILRADKLMRDILYLTEADSYIAYLSGPNNFRKQIYSEYKANRKDKPKPIHLKAVREYLITNWDYKAVDGCEADDMLSVDQHRNLNTIIASIDKDLLQVPGRHFNFVKTEFYDITPAAGIRKFYESLLKGDKADNIPGITGLGEKKAARLLEGCENEQEMFDVCREQYKNDELMLTYGRLLHLWRFEGDIWDGLWQLTGQNHSGQEEEVNVESTQEMQTESSQFTAHTTVVPENGS